MSRASPVGVALLLRVLGGVLAACTWQTFANFTRVLAVLAIGDGFDARIHRLYYTRCVIYTILLICKCARAPCREGRRHFVANIGCWMICIGVCIW